MSTRWNENLQCANDLSCRKCAAFSPREMRLSNGEFLHLEVIDVKSAERLGTPELKMYTFDRHWEGSGVVCVCVCVFEN